MMPLGREIPLRAGGLAIDLTCKLTVVLSTNTYVEKGYFMVCVPFNREFDRWLDAIQVISQGFYMVKTGAGRERCTIST